MIKENSSLKCPYCGHIEVIKMPKDNCLYFHQCKNCEKLINPKPGDCCVFCSYGDVPCPSIQLENMKQ